jgi:hypothetical protein
MEAGKFEEGLAAAADALSVAERTGASSWNPELYRLKGELLLMQGAGLEGEAFFRRVGCPLLAAPRTPQPQDSAFRSLDRLSVSCCSERLYQRCH